LEFEVDYVGVDWDLEIWRFEVDFLENIRRGSEENYLFYEFGIC
jgi:hypothetical protein